MRSSLNTTIQPSSEKAIYNNFITIKNSKSTASTAVSKVLPPLITSSITNKKNNTDDPHHRHQIKDDIFQKYIILEEYGTGSMGAIYKVKLNPKYATTIVQQHQQLPTSTNATKKKGLFSALRRTFTTTSPPPPTASTVEPANVETAKEVDAEERVKMLRLTKSLPAPPSSSQSSSSKVNHPNNDNIYALKSILLDRISDEYIQELKNEIMILQHLDHPNIVKAYEVYTIPHQTIYLVMECCTGGDLYTRQIPPQYYTERIAAHITTQLLSAVCYMHDHGIVHRDLKYENILFENTDPTNYTIKVIDFGLSKKFRINPNSTKNYSLDHQLMYERVGTIYTMSPQVIQGIYTSQADLWSIGVICYMLLSNTKPFFHPKSRHKTIELIMAGEISFTKTPIWDHISDDAKNFVTQLLQYDPDQRLHASSALQHRWIKHRELLPNELPSPDLLQAIDDSLLNYYYNTSQLKKIALTVIAHRSTTQEILELRKVFDSIDTEKDGIITIHEFKDALLSMNFPENEISSVFSAVDLNQNGKINYTEFLAATIEIYGNIEERRIIEAFDRIDSDEDGYISRKNLQEALGKDHTKEKVDEIMRVSDLDQDGKISYPEFLAAFRKQTSKAIIQTYDTKNNNSDDDGIV